MNQISKIEDTNTREVEEVVEEFEVNHGQYTSHESREDAKVWLRTTLTQDRATLHTSLVAAVDKLPVYYRPIQINGDYSKRDESSDIIEMYSKAQVDTIINNIFKG